MPKPAAAIRSVTTPAASLVAICAKCSKKLGGGFGSGGAMSLGKALRRELGLPKPKRARVRIVETKCLKLCPKAAVAVVHSGDPGAILIVPAGLAVMAVAGQLGLVPALPAPPAA